MKLNPKELEVVVVALRSLRAEITSKEPEDWDPWDLDTVTNINNALEKLIGTSAEPFYVLSEEFREIDLEDE